MEYVNDDEPLLLGADLLKALGHPVRLRIAAGLLERGCCVGTMAECLGIAQPLVSRHLAVLRDAGVVSVQREGRQRRYRVAHPSVRPVVEAVLGVLDREPFPEDGLECTLHTPRLILRPLTLDDAPVIQRRFGRWEVIRHLSTQVPWPYPPDGALTFLRDVLFPRIEAGEAMAWGLVLRDGPDEVIGVIDVNPGESELGNRGLWISPEYGKQGLVTEAVIAVQDHLLLTLSWPKIVVVNAVDNEASSRLKTRTGAVLVGHTQLPHHDGGDESEVWEVTRERWTALRAGDA